MATYARGRVNGVCQDAHIYSHTSVLGELIVFGCTECLLSTQLKAWEFDWPDAESPETTSYEALHYRMSLHEAMHLALQNERAAQRYYRQFAGDSSDEQPTRLAAAVSRMCTKHARPCTASLHACAMLGARKLCRESGSLQLVEGPLPASPCMRVDAFGQRALPCSEQKEMRILAPSAFIHAHVL